jgi:hypothetical protein
MCVERRNKKQNMIPEIASSTATSSIVPSAATALVGDLSHTLMAAQQYAPPPAEQTFTWTHKLTMDGRRLFCLI